MPPSFTAAKTASSVASLRCFEPIAHVELNAIVQFQNSLSHSWSILRQKSFNFYDSAWMLLAVSRYCCFKVGAGWIFSYDGSSHAMICEFLKPATAVVNVRTIKIHQRLNAQWKWTPSSNPGRFVPLWSIKGKCHLTTVALGPYSW